jgi:hypothetical protein
MQLSDNGHRSVICLVRSERWLTARYVAIVRSYL